MSVALRSNLPPSRKPTRTSGVPERLPARWALIISMSLNVAAVVGSAEGWILGLLAGLGAVGVLYWVIE